MRGTGARGVCGRAGFTLVELLVTVAIIAILAGVGLSTLFLAQEAAREDRTRMLISKLHNQLMIRWESYQTRRLPLQISVGKYRAQKGSAPNQLDVATHYGANGETAEQFAWRLLWARRELMRFELPDRYSDIWNFETDSVRLPKYLIGISGEDSMPHRRYLQRIARLRGVAPTSPAMSSIMSSISDENSSAECLYLIVTTGMEVDASGKKIFDERHVGDEDEDGMPEFVDGWGEPIRWIRWPAGFVSDLQPRVPDTQNVVPNALLTRNPDANHDAFDPRQIDDAWDEQSQMSIGKAGWIPDAPDGWPDLHPSITALPDPANELPDPQNAPAERGYRLFPLIYSGGPDRVPGLYHFAGLDQNNPSKTHDVDPYWYYAPKEEPGRRRQRGEPIPDAVLPQINPQWAGGSHLDNIHNHDLMGR